MGVKADKNNSNYIKEFILQSKKNVHNQIVYFLNSVGLHCLAYARDNGLYTDRTGNLRSSVGYIIYHKGNVLEINGFDANENEAEPNIKDGVTGAASGKDLALSLGDELKHDYTLVFVAGMFYAEYVEKKGYDVLIGTQIEAEVFAQQLFNKLNERVQGI